MPEPDRLQVLHAHDVTQLPRADDLLDGARVRRVPHHVADRQHDPGLLHRRHDPPAPRLVRRHRLFQQDVIPGRGERLGRLSVHPILRADQHRVGETGAAGQVSPVRGHVLRWDAVPGHEPGAAHFMGFRYPRHQRAIRVAPDPPGIPGAALTRPDDDHRDRCHISDLPCQARIVAHGYAAGKPPPGRSAPDQRKPRRSGGAIWAAITRHGIVSPRRSSPSRGVASTTTPNQRPRISQPPMRTSNLVSSSRHSCHRSS